jgi:glyoxylase-like metal-dependent hydrolase (beta-lactamase superfamily II)
MLSPGIAWAARLQGSGAVPRVIDCMHLGRDRVIGAWEVEPGLIADPGPASTVATLLAGVEAEPRALLLTHIHLDHAGAAGVLARRFPALRVYVHEAGAPHLIDPTRLVQSAGRLYGDEMERLWGEVAPVPAERVTAVRGGEEVEGCRVHDAPGHAGSHVVYAHGASGDVFTGDVAGVRIPPSRLVMAPTPPPEIDVEAWLGSIELLRNLRPTRLCMTHFGAEEDPPGQLAAVEAYLRQAAEVSSGGDRDEFARWLSAVLDAEGAEVTVRVRQAMPPDHQWLGLERYWRMRRESLARRGMLGR